MQWSVAWFRSYRAKHIADAERKFSRKRNVFYIVTVNCNVYTIVLHKIDLCSCKKAARNSEKTVVVKAGTYIVSVDKKETLYKLEACEIAFFANACFSCT